MSTSVPNSLSVPAPLISEQQQNRFKQSFRKVRNISFLGFGLGVISEFAGHSSPGFVATGMELTDTGILLGMDGTSNLDKAGKHREASTWRQRMFAGHIAIAAVGIAESIRLMHESSEPNITNVVIAALIGALNARYLYDNHRETRSSKANADSSVDYVETSSPEMKQLAHTAVSAQVEHERNVSGVAAIARTNVAEAAGGLAGAASYFAFEQGPAVAAIASSSAVIYIMGKQILAERRAGTHELVANS